MIGRVFFFPTSGLKTVYSSGFTAPFTTISPKPQAALMRTTFGKPLSVSIENMTPALSARTIFCTPAESATLR